MKIITIIVAAGYGKRLKTNTLKQFVKINRIPLLAYTLKIFQFCDLVDEILLVVPENFIEFCQTKIIEKYKFTKVKKIVEGGKYRQNSVYNGLKNIKDCNIVLIHDGVRPFITTSLIEQIIKETFKFGVVIPSIKVKETIKEVDKQFVKNTLLRDNLLVAQTPQGFKFDLIINGYEQAIKNKIVAFDDASLVEKLGIKVKIIEGLDNNIKITTPMDLILAKEIIRNESFIK